MLPGARHVFVQSDAMGDMVAAQGIARDKITAVPMGVDTELIVQPEGTGSRLDHAEEHAVRRGGGVRFAHRPFRRRDHVERSDGHAHVLAVLARRCT